MAPFERERTTRKPWKAGGGAKQDGRRSIVPLLCVRARDCEDGLRMTCQAGDDDRIREFLARRGCADRIVEGGRRALLDVWESVAAEVRSGGLSSLDTYVQGIDARQLLDELSRAGFAVDGAEASRLAAADARFRAGTSATAGRVQTSLGTGGVPLEPASQWWYFARPIRLDAALAGDWLDRFG